MRLENALRRVRSQRALVVLHYAPIVDTVEGEPREIYPFLGSSRLAETIDRFPVTRLSTVTLTEAHITGRHRVGRRFTMLRPMWKSRRENLMPCLIFEPGLSYELAK